MPKVNFYIGNDFFREIREENCYYVDKTKFIEEFLTDSKKKTTLFTRPRRFGKTLTMTMLREFFDINAENKNLFEGLYISKNEELCKKWQNQYPVIYLTLKGCEGLSFEEVIERFSRLIGDTAASFPYLEKSERLIKKDNEDLLTLQRTKDVSLLSDSLKILCKILHSYYHKKVILLIDEYDVPVNNAYHKGFYEEMIAFMRSFLGAALKGNEHLEFAILTGCLRIAKESIFTGLNNFKCFGISDIEFSTTFGFTSEEVATILIDAELEDKKPLFKEWYDGYTFGDNTEMYCPWDVSNYVADLQKNPSLAPKLYWNQTSGNEIIKDFLKRTDFQLTEKFEDLMDGKCVEITPSDQQTYNFLHSSEDNFWNILYFTGYLTKASEMQVRQYGKEPEEGNILLTIPNKEIRQIYKTSIKEWLQEDYIRPERRNFLEAFWNNDAEKIEAILSSVLSASISCRDYYESFYQGTLLGLFFGTGCEVVSNRESGLGYYDLLITHPIKLIAALIEIKRADSLEFLEKEASAALEQIDKNQYAANVRGYKEVRHWGIAFYRKRCIAVVKNSAK